MYNSNRVTQALYVVSCCQVSMRTWSLGIALCKLVPMMAGTNVFVSTITITAIALDRFHLIVHPTEKDLLTARPGATALAISAIWMLAVLLATPLLGFSTIKLINPFAGLHYEYEVCYENPELHYIKATYSVASLLCQYLLPILIVSVAHAQICNKLRRRMTSANSRPTSVCVPSSSASNYSPPFPVSSSTGASVTSARPGATAVIANVESTSLLVPPVDTNRKCSEDAAMPSSPVSENSPSGLTSWSPSNYQARKRRKEASRKRKTNRLLVAIAVVFALSWLPLNLCNIVADVDSTLLMSLFDKRTAVVIAVCHLLVLCSACANPVLYGWLNDNFRREFLAVLCPTRLVAAVTSSLHCCRSTTRSCCCCCCAQTPPVNASLSPMTGNDVIMIVVRDDASRSHSPPTVVAMTSPSGCARGDVDARCVRRHRKDFTNGRLVGSVERRRQRQQQSTSCDSNKNCRSRPLDDTAVTPVCVLPMTLIQDSGTSDKMADRRPEIES